MKPQQFFQRLILTVMLLVQYATASCSASNEIKFLRPSLEAIPAEYFGLHIHRIAGTTPWPSIPFGAWRLMDAYVAWPSLEPVKGCWNFEMLDKYVSYATDHRVELLLPLTFTPTWASARPTERSAYVSGNAAEPDDIEDWRNYVRTVALRYKGRIRHYEIWNEPNLSRFFSGSVDQMINLAREAYAILKEVDSNNVIVSPAATQGDKGLAWLESYFSKGGGNYADVIGYHFYVTPRPPEAMVPIALKVRDLMAKYGQENKALWNTESGWLIGSLEQKVNPAVVGFPKKWTPLSAAEASAYVSRSLILGWAAGIRRYYWYAWDNLEMGLIEPNSKKLKAPALAFKKTSEWLKAANIQYCQLWSRDIWVCHLVKNNRSAWLAWSTSDTQALTLPSGWGAKEIETLNGRSFAINGADITLLPAPMLIKTDMMPWE